MAAILEIKMATFYVEMHFEVKLKPKDYFQTKSRLVNSNEA